MHTVELQTYRTLRRRLLCGDLQPGARLSALAISKEMGISPTPVMQAIRRLESEGFVGLVPHWGAFVRQPSIREIAELFDLRRALESFAVRRAARRATNDQVERLRRTCEVWRSSIPPRQVTPDDEAMIVASFEADLLFHMYIMDIAGSRRALRMFRDCHLLTRVFGSHRALSPSADLDDERRDLEEHEQIVAAIQARSPGKARRAMDRHLATGRRRLITRLRNMNAGERQPQRSPSLIRALNMSLEKIENYRPGSL